MSTGHGVGAPDSPCRGVEEVTRARRRRPSRRCCGLPNTRTPSVLPSKPLWAGSMIVSGPDLHLERTANRRGRPWPSKPRSAATGCSHYTPFAFPTSFGGGGPALRGLADRFLYRSPLVMIAQMMRAVLLSDRVRKPNPLAHQQQAGPMQHHHALLLRSLHRNKAHGRPAHRLADRLSVGRIVLLAFDVGLHVWRIMIVVVMAVATIKARFIGILLGLPRWNWERFRQG